MIDITIAEYSTLLFIVASLFIVIVIIIVNSKFNHLHQWMNPPLHYRMRVKNKKALQNVLKELHNLSFEESVAVVQQIFGRPIRYIAGLDKNGEQWLENVSPFAPMNETDQNYHRQSIRSKDKGIG